MIVKSIVSLHQLKLFNNNNVTEKFITMNLHKLFSNTNATSKDASSVYKENEKNKKVSKIKNTELRTERNSVTRSSLQYIYKENVHHGKKPHSGFKYTIL